MQSYIANCWTACQVPKILDVNHQFLNFFIISLFFNNICCVKIWDSSETEENPVDFPYATYSSLKPWPSGAEVKRVKHRLVDAKRCPTMYRAYRSLSRNLACGGTCNRHENGSRQMLSIHDKNLFSVIDLRYSNIKNPPLRDGSIFKEKEKNLIIPTFLRLDSNIKWRMLNNPFFNHHQNIQEIQNIWISLNSKF